MLNDHVIVYIGDIGEYLSIIAKSRDPLAKLIDSSNYKNLKPGVYYSSLGDLTNLGEFGAVLQQAREIIYAPPAHWRHNQTKIWTEDYLQICHADSEKKVIGFQPTVDPLSDACRQLESYRAVDTAQIWIAGCSISHGLGVDPEQRYGNIIAEHFCLPITYLTKPASSVCWAADQILRSDVRPGDKIFWGVTSPHRLTYWNDTQNTVGYAAIPNFVNHKKFLGTIVKENFLSSNHVKYQSILSVRQVNNFCHKLKVEIVLSTLLSGLENEIKDLSNFVPLAGLFGRNHADLFLDTGTDGIHPGPKSHAFYAEGMIKKYHKLYDPEN